MIIQYFLTASLICLAAYGLNQSRRSRSIATLIVVFGLAGTLLVWFPDFANVIAHVMGVGRGADLILYCFVLISFTAILNLHLRLRAQRDAMTKLVRAVAVLTAEPPQAT